MTAKTLRFSPVDAAELAREYEDNLQHGRAFARDAAGIDVLADCVLLLVHPDTARELRLPAQAVMVVPAGVGFELRPFDDAIRSRIHAFVTDPDAEGSARGEPANLELEPPVPDDELGAEGKEVAPAEEVAEDDTRDLQLGEATPEHEAPEDAALEEAAPEEDAPEEDALHADALDADALDDEPLLDGEAPLDSASELQAQRPRHEKLRNLNSAQQAKLARRGELTDRVMLERLYGKNVWEPLLQNPRITVPEVARIARKGTVPRPLLEVIVENNTWIAAPIVRRALLSNPRVGGDGILKLLRLMPKHELKVIVKTTTYSTQVRDTAKKLLKQPD